MSKIDRTKPQGLVQPVQTPRAPAQSYNVDLIVGLPKIDTTEGDYSKILVAIDRFSTRTFLDRSKPRKSNMQDLAESKI